MDKTYEEPTFEEMVMNAIQEVQGQMTHVTPNDVDLAIPAATMSTWQVFMTLERLRKRGKILISQEEVITLSAFPASPAGETMDEQTFHLLLSLLEQMEIDRIKVINVRDNRFISTIGMKTFRVVTEDEELYYISFPEMLRFPSQLGEHHHG